MKTVICGLMLAGFAGLTSFAEELTEASQGRAQTVDASAQKESIAEGEKVPLSTDLPAARTASTNKTETIIGKRVFDTNGTELGHVQDLVVDMEKGELGYVVLRVKTEDGPRKLPVPARALKVGEREGTLVLNISQAVLAAAEVYRDEELPEPNAFSVDSAVGAAAGAEQGSASSKDSKVEEQPKKTAEQDKAEK